MHAEYGILVYTIWPLFPAQPHLSVRKTRAHGARHFSTDWQAAGLEQVVLHLLQS